MQLTFCHPDGRVEAGMAEAGASLLDAARGVGIADIGGFCGGICACVHCMVRVDPEWIDAVGPPDPTEAGMLRIGGDPGPGFRLACQIRLTPALAGLVVHVLPHGD